MDELICMTPEQIRAEYWTHSIIDGKVIWKNSNAQKYFQSQGIEWKDYMRHIGVGATTAACGRCGKPDLSFTAEKRSEFVDLVRRLHSGNGRCPECWEKDQQEAELRRQEVDAQAEIERQQEAEEREREAEEQKSRLAAKRRALELKHGALLTDVICPECSDGYLVVRMTSDGSRLFAGCSCFNSYRNSCRYAQPLAPEEREKYLDVFRKRLGIGVKEAL
jgi:ssDNA-binding Zn-finger/Zn-ribbon topoisomerase 1